MNHNSEPSKTNEVIEEFKARQRNVQWHDAFSNGRGVDEYLWKGDPKAPLVQRLGAIVFGIFFIITGLMWMYISREKNEFFFGLISILWVVLGIKIFANAFRRGKSKSSETK